MARTSPVPTDLEGPGLSRSFDTAQGEKRRLIEI